ncbi:MAG: hypothetical protein ABI147_09225 [Acidobacteriaceae bacterium]
MTTLRTRISGNLSRFAKVLILCVSIAPFLQAQSDHAAIALPTGQSITPLAAKGAIFESLNPHLPGRPEYTAGQASAVALSPDQRTLLVLTSGYNLIHDAQGKLVPKASTEYVFVYDVSGERPIQTQVLQIPNTLFGLAWRPKGDKFYVSGGVDDVVYEYSGAPGTYALARSFHLGHKAGVGNDVHPGVSGIAVSPDGLKLLAANYQNDSVTLIDLNSGRVIAERDLRPGVTDAAKSGVAGGTFPRAVIWLSNRKAYVASQRDREIIELVVATNTLTIGDRVKTPGQPVAFAKNSAATRLFVALDNADGVAVFDAVHARLIETLPTAAPRRVWSNSGKLGGAGSNALDLSPDGRTLLVSNGGENAIAILGLDDRAAGLKSTTKSSEREPEKDKQQSSVIGLIPTGWYPTGVAVRADGRLFIVNAKSPPGPNPEGCRKTTADTYIPCLGANQYVWQLEKAGFLTLPMPTGAELARLTRQVALNDHFPNAGSGAADETIDFLRQHIHHIVYIVKENRGYDQILGDLGIGNGDPRLTLLPEPITPNHHALAREFVTLDAFFDSGESSNTGWNWTTAARTNDFTEREAPVNYANRGLQYDQEGGNRDVNVGYATAAQRVAANPLSPPDPNVLAGTADVAAPDGPDGNEGHGYLWDVALKAGKTIRNYGFYGDLSRYTAKPPKDVTIPLDRNPFASRLQVFFPTKAALHDITDPYFRGFDQAFPDYWRYKEWEREFDGYAKDGKLPELTLLRLPHDHFGSFKKAIDGVNTVETEMADNDYALGLIVEKISSSRFASDTLIFVLEDDAQNGADHVDAHRSMAFVLGPYVKHRALVSTHHDTVDVLRTIEDILNIGPMGLNDGLAKPMTDLFDVKQAAWSYKARVPAILHTTKLPLSVESGHADVSSWPHSTHTAQWWEAIMAGQNFDEEDRLDTVRFNKALWLGLKGSAPSGVPRPR